MSYLKSSKIPTTLSEHTTKKVCSNQRELCYSNERLKKNPITLIDFSVQTRVGKGRRKGRGSNHQFAHVCCLIREWVFKVTKRMNELGFVIFKVVLGSFSCHFYFIFLLYFLAHIQGTSNTYIRIFQFITNFIISSLTFLNSLMFL